MSDSKISQAVNNEGRELNKKIAELHGWTSLFNIGGALMGTPPDKVPSMRNQALVPDWAGDWKDCGELMAYYRCFPNTTKPSEVMSNVGYQRRMRHAVCQHVIDTLTARPYLINAMPGLNNDVVSAGHEYE